MVYLHNEILLSGNKQQHLEICGQMDGTRKKILSEVTQTQKNKHGMYSHKWVLYIKQRLTSLLSTTPEKKRNKENPKRDTQILLGRGSRQHLFSNVSS